MSYPLKFTHLDNIFVERHRCRLNFECVYLHAWEASLEERAGVNKWVKSYNHKNPNSAHGGQLPDVVY